jgi:hypothetical protein
LSGWVKIEKPGVNSFYTFADDGTRLTIGNQRIIDVWTPHSAKEQIGSVHLKLGWHKFCLECFQGTSPGCLSLFWSGPNIPRQILSSPNVQNEPIHN